MTVAILHSIGDGKSELKLEDARAMAEHILRFFGYQEEIIDNILEPEDRDAFYMIEDTGLLTTSREETTLYDGREWRIHHWLFRKERLLKILSEAFGQHEEKKKREETGEVCYDDPGMWDKAINGRNGNGEATSAVK